MLAGNIATEGKYRQALTHGLETIPVARQFNEVFSDTINSFTYYTGTAGSPLWWSETALYNRYELTLTIGEIEFNADRTKVIKYGKTAFVLDEVTHIKLSPEGAHSAEMGGLHKRFGAAEWQKLYEARGDFSVLGIGLKKDSPVPGFDVYWKDLKEKAAD